MALGFAFRREARLCFGILACLIGLALIFLFLICSLPASFDCLPLRFTLRRQTRLCFSLLAYLIGLALHFLFGSEARHLFGSPSASFVYLPLRRTLRRQTRRCFGLQACLIGLALHFLFGREACFGSPACFVGLSLRFRLLHQTCRCFGLLACLIGLALHFLFGREACFGSPACFVGLSLRFTLRYQTRLYFGLVARFVSSPLYILVDREKFFSICFPVRSPRRGEMCVSLTDFVTFTLRHRGGRQARLSSLMRRLALRTAFATLPSMSRDPENRTCQGEPYSADDDQHLHDWRPSCFCPYPRPRMAIEIFATASARRSEDLDPLGFDPRLQRVDRMRA